MDRFNTPDRDECEHVGRHEFVCIGIAVVAVGQQVGQGAVHHIRYQPGMEVIEIKPLYRVDVEFEHGKGGGMSRMDDGPVVIICPRSGGPSPHPPQGNPMQQNPAPHFAEIRSPLLAMLPL